MRMTIVNGEPLGTVKLLPPDENGYPRQQRLEAVTVCIVCGEDVGLWAETHEWVKEGKRWRHRSYGPADGQCCDHLYFDDFDCVRVFDLTEDAEEES